MCNINKDHPTLTDILTASISTQLSVHNWSLKILSEHSGVPYETLKKIVNGKIENPSLKSIIKIAAAFGCSVDYLLGIGVPNEQQTKKQRTDVYSYLNSL